MNYENDVIEDLETSDLVVDAIDAAGSKGIGKANEVIHRLLPGISNSGGFRTAKKGANGRVVVLFSSTRHPDWGRVITRQVVWTSQLCSVEKAESAGPLKR